MTIKKQDGSVYWVEFFPDDISATKWIDEEKTRTYWNKTYTVELETIISETAVESAEEIARKAAVKKAKDELINLDKTKIKNLGDLIEVCEKLMIAAGVK
jgi:hypothetical protein